MGSDKAVLPLAGRSLLERAAATLAAVSQDVTLVGRSHATLRSIPDAATQVGPVGGIAAALQDLTARRADWAFVLPVDVPLLPAGLLCALIDRWLADPHIRVAFPVCDRPQPAISLVHVSALPAFAHAISTGQHRLRLVLETAASASGSLAETQLTFRSGSVLADEQPLPWQPDVAERRLRPFWFSNCNTPADLAQLETALASCPLTTAAHY